MKYTGILFLALFIVATMTAQTKIAGPVGEYYLQGVMEVGSGFRINADHSFDFFYSYGAIDREARGTWVKRGDSIILNSAKKPPLDFKLENFKKTADPEITIRILGDNKTILRNVYAAIQSGDSIYRNVADDSGKIHFDTCRIDKISLIHDFWPDRFSVFTIPDGQINYFEFSIEKWIADVSFDNFVLATKNHMLTGRHPLLQEKQYQYIKGQ